MMGLRLEAIHAESRAFARHHGIALPRAASMLAIGDARSEGGAFGTVHPLGRSGQKASATALVVKVFDPDALAGVGGPDVVAGRVLALQEALGASPDSTWPDRALALPFSAATARLEGEPRLVTFMLDLEALGYREASFDPEEARHYRARAPHERIELAYSFCHHAALFDAISFVHGDLNPENLFLNDSTLDAQIIDLDSGVIAGGGARPLAPGKRDECMPPEIKGAGPRAKPFDMDLYTPGAERWSLGSMVGFLLFSVHPGFFLKAISGRTVDAYAQQGPIWPAIAEDGPAFNADEANRRAYRAWRRVFEAAPGNTREAFATFFAAGTRGDSRPSARDWMAAIGAARRPPSFEFVTVEPRVVPEGEEVTVAWAAIGADRVESPILGELPVAGQAKVIAERSMRLSLTAINYYGRNEQPAEAFRVVPLPRLARLPVASFPPLSLSASVALPPPARQLELPALPTFVRPNGALPRAPIPPVRRMVAASPWPVALPSAVLAPLKFRPRGGAR